MKKTDAGKITKTIVDKTNEPGDYPDSEVKGFYLRVRTSGTKSYVVRGRVKGQKGKITYTLGKHGSLTANEAREMAQSILANMRKGIDPRESDKQEQRDEQEARRVADVELKTKQLTLKAVFEDWINVERQRPERKTKDSTISLYEDVLFKHLRDWLDKPIKDITEDMVVKRYRLVASETIGSANNTFRALRMLLNWAIKEYRDTSEKPLINANPVTILADRKEWIKVKPRKKFIRDEDLHAWYQSVCKLKNTAVRDYFVFLLLTGLRSKEASTLKWSEVDFRSKCFTAIDTKNGSDHVLPLTDYTLKLLKDRKSKCGESEYVFPSEILSDGHIDDVRWHEKLVEDDCQVEFSPHVLRATFSMAAAREVSEAERKALLNHRDGSDVTSEHYTGFTAGLLLKPLAKVETVLVQRMIDVPDASNIVEMKKRRKAR